MRQSPNLSIFKGSGETIGLLSVLNGGRVDCTTITGIEDRNVFFKIHLPGVQQDQINISNQGNSISIDVRYQEGNLCSLLFAHTLDVPFFCELETTNYCFENNYLSIFFPFKN